MIPNEENGTELFSVKFDLDSYISTPAVSKKEDSSLSKAPQRPCLQKANKGIGNTHLHNEKTHSCL